MARTKKATATATDPAEQYIRETCSELEGRYDRAALALICGPGIFAVEDPAELDEVINRLRDVDEDGHSDKIVDAQERAATGATEAARRKAVNDLEELDLTEVDSIREAAYLLGIAVGRGMMAAKRSTAQDR